MIIIAFCAFLLLFVIIGVLSTLKSVPTTHDYLLAGQNVKPWLAGLSAVATSNSGYMFIGIIGFTYLTGPSVFWLMSGWIFGDMLASTFIHKRLRIATEKAGVLSFTGALARWQGTDYRVLRAAGGIVTVIFLGIYAAAQFNAGSKALHVLFGWDHAAGAVMGAIIVLLYCFAGGLRASIWTDVAQSFVMISAMGLLCFTAITEIGGFSAYLTAINAVSTDYTSLFPASLPALDLGLGGLTGPLLFVLGWVFAGLGVTGQPHIMARFMVMDRPENMWRVRIYYYAWEISFYTLAIGTALSARILLNEPGSFDAELALPTLALELLPEALVGLILAGLFAATMSTADSQILSCTAAITRDFDFSPKDEQPFIESYTMTKLCTVLVTALALAIALSGNESVFQLVLIAWAALASGFTPLMAVYALGGKPSEKTAVAMMISGLAVMLGWRYFGFNAYIYEAAPGIIAGLLPYGISRLFSGSPIVGTAAKSA